MLVLPNGVMNSGARLRRNSVSIPLLLLTAITPAVADTNNWTKPTSGYWEEQAYWSLGVLPDVTQDIVFNNPNWKALAIGPQTARNFPQSMQVQSLRIGAPVNSFNTFLMNFSGFERPLQTYNLIVETNSAVVMLSSSLAVILSTNGADGNLLVGGSFSQGEFSQVRVHGALNVGRFTHGAYFLTNGILMAGSEIIGGFGPGDFVQYGGSNTMASLQVGTEGQYQLYGGEVTATNGITVGMGDFAIEATFLQHGGSVNADTVINGRYVLNEGNIAGRMSVPSGALQRVDGSVLQNGGTNRALSLDLGHPNRFGGRGIYVLSNGVVRVDSSVAFRGGQFSQYNGLHTIVSNLVMHGTDVGIGIASADYFLEGGTLSAGGLTLQAATFQQNGGTNLIAADLVLTGLIPQTSRYTLAGGFLSARNVIANATFNGGFRQAGGSNHILEKLTVQGVISGSYGYTLEGGTLLVKDIEVAASALFQHTNGTVIHSGVLTLAGGHWQARPGAQSLGPMRLASDPAVSSIDFPGSASVLRLANSSGQAWSPTATLHINNWQGSASGAGETQLFFGSDANGLTSQQLALIRFALPAGLFPARLLPTGELVPQQFLAFSRSGSTLTLTWAPGWILQSSPDVAGPYQDVQGATSPYMASTINPSEFFRLRQ